MSERNRSAQDDRRRLADDVRRTAGYMEAVVTRARRLDVLAAPGRERLRRPVARLVPQPRPSRRRGLVTCPLCREPVRPGEPVALVARGDQVRVIHLVPCGGLLLVLNDALRTAELLATADALGTLPTPN